MDVKHLSITELHAAYTSRELSVEAVTSAYLDSITKRDGSLQAYLTVLGEAAMGQADALDERLRHGEQPIGLFGVPIAIKDNMCLAGTRTTAASKILDPYVAPYTATAVQKVADSGAVILGKTNLDEFAMGSSTENSAYQKTANPWDTTRVPGGSSGGSAVAVASQQALVALGSDTGGSIRQPASLCGVVGLKPTYGRVSRHGLIALSSSLDQIGPFARNVSDAFSVYQAIVGRDAYDATTTEEASVNRDVLTKGLAGLRVGFLEAAMLAGMDEEVKARVQEALALMEKAGAKIVPLKIPSAKLSLALYYVIVTSEVSSNLARYDGLRYGVAQSPVGSTFQKFTTANRSHGLGQEAQRRSILGTYTLSKGYADRYYNRAHELMDVVAQDFAAAFRDVDVLFGPTAPTVAFKLGEKFNDPLTMYLSDIFTVPANIANLPAISMPIGFAHQLPVGGQFMGPQFGEGQIFQAAAGYEAESGFTNLVADGLA
ncbi:MAG: Asp-tRNA(Asn)/Glu-tRNA(Gln) amidotransferase subunit GatA [bacterium]|nr:Asp-tRNA(Asn)/Glu-tRNA(Gln) amidotransferase subunit GatA [bacterium]